MNRVVCKKRIRFVICYTKQSLINHFISIKSSLRNINLCSHLTIFCFKKILLIRHISVTITFFTQKRKNSEYTTKSLKCSSVQLHVKHLVSRRLTTLLLTFVKVVVARKNSIFHFMIWSSGTILWLRVSFWYCSL